MRKMSTTLKDYGLSVYKVCVIGVGLIFCIVSMILALVSGETQNILYILSTVLLLFVPVIVGNLMKFSINTVMFTFIIFYAITPLLGSMYKLYYLTSWWDDLLHFFGGVVFSMLGIFVAKYLNRNNKNSLIMCAVFGFCFSLTIAVLWEFFEYGMDVFFGRDMQVDTIITYINSYLLGNEAGVQGSIDNIQSVVVNGQVLEGYIDIGLIDTMKDMIVECLGALIYCVISLVDRDRHPLITSISREKDQSRLDPAE